ncbi:hypothetical protein GE107_06525 [Cohnella sp. CFH 77786]|nr:hypothetical protein [Cohnella sp. CFH 77786]
MKKRNRVMATALIAALLLPMGLVSEAAAAEYVPLRAQLEKLGAAITWDEEDRAALFTLKNGISGVVTIGENEYRLRFSAWREKSRYRSGNEPDE